MCAILKRAPVSVMAICLATILPGTFRVHRFAGIEILGCFPSVTVNAFVRSTCQDVQIRVCPLSSPIRPSFGPPNDWLGYTSTTNSLPLESGMLRARFTIHSEEYFTPSVR